MNFVMRICKTDDGFDSVFRMTYVAFARSNFGFPVQLTSARSEE